MKNKNLIAIIAIITILMIIIIGIYKQKNPIFMINDIKFSVQGGLKNNFNNTSEILGNKIGKISKETILIPKNDEEGFKVKKNSNIYNIKKEYKEIYPYSIIIEIDNKYYISDLYIDDPYLTTEYLEKFNKNL
ncbi:MAG: hypothetical protein RSE41_11045 [Clostridia bacterium]